MLFRAIHIHVADPTHQRRRRLSEAKFAICIEGTMIGAFDIQLEERRKGIERDGSIFNFKFLSGLSTTSIHDVRIWPPDILNLQVLNLE